MTDISDKCLWKNMSEELDNAKFKDVKSTHKLNDCVDCEDYMFGSLCDDYKSHLFYVLKQGGYDISVFDNKVVTVNDRYGTVLTRDVDKWFILSRFKVIKDRHTGLVYERCD